VSWDYDYRVVGEGPLSAWADIIRLDEGVAGLRATPIEIPFLPGVLVGSDPRPRWRMARLDTRIRLSDDGADHHERRGELARLLRGEFRLSRIDPHLGVVEATAIVLDGAQQGAGTDRFWLSWPLWLGPWESEERSDTQTGVGTSDSWTLGVSGNIPTEPVFAVECVAGGANPAITAGGSTLTLAGSFTAGQEIVVDVPERTVTVDDVESTVLLTVSRAKWMEIGPDPATLVSWAASSGTWDVTTTWRDRWL